MPYQDPNKKLEYQRRYQEDNKKALLKKKRERINAQREYIRKAKDRPCRDCGRKYPHYVMDFDHVRGKKKFNLNRLSKMAASWDTIDAEIEKCEVVCSNCHRERTYGSRSG